MKLRLKSSGGLGNIRIEGQLDTAELPPDVARTVEAGLSVERLEAATQRAASAGPTADAQQYELVVLPDEPTGPERTFHVDDMCDATDVLDAIDALMHEIIRRKASALES